VAVAVDERRVDVDLIPAFRILIQGLAGGGDSRA
jgi:hypothetical protein